MDVVFASSALRHGYARLVFYELLAGRYLKIRSQRGLDDVYELFGRNLGGGYLHIVYRVLVDGGLRGFHISRMTEKQKRRYQRYQR